MNVFRALAKRLGWRQACRFTTIEVDVTKQEASHPQVVVRLICNHTGLTLGEAFYNPDRADHLADEVHRLAGNVRGWVESGRQEGRSS